MFRNLLKLMERDHFLSYSLTRQTNNIYLSFYSTTTKQLSYLRRKRKIIPLSGWLLLSVPVASFSLGVWQIGRKQWKESLIADLKKKSDCEPVDLPNSLEEIKELEYKPVRVKGRFLHDKEMYMGPRTFLSGGDASTNSSLMTEKSTTGFLVVTPFKLEDRDEIILINRGWVPSKERDPRARSKGQVEGSTNVIGVVRLNEQRPNFSIKNKEGSNLYFYRDFEKMTASTGASPIYLDATNDFDIPGGPIGGQTRITLRNEHLSYILTWFTLSGATSYMWYFKFLK